MTGVVDSEIYKLKAQMIGISDELELRHRRIALLGIRNLALLKDKLAIGVSFLNVCSSQLDYVACLLGKQTRKLQEPNTFQNWWF